MAVKAGDIAVLAGLGVLAYYWAKKKGAEVTVETITPEGAVAEQTVTLTPEMLQQAAKEALAYKEISPGVYAPPSPTLVAALNLAQVAQQKIEAGPAPGAVKPEWVTALEAFVADYKAKCPHKGATRGKFGEYCHLYVHKYEDAVRRLKSWDAKYWWLTAEEKEALKVGMYNYFASIGVTVKAG